MAIQMPDTRPLTVRMLTFPYRDYVINNLKLPLQRAIESATNLAQMAQAVLDAAVKLVMKFGAMEDAKILEPTTQCFLEHKAKLLSYLNIPYRKKLISAIYDIIISENEHDAIYRDMLGAEVEWIIEDVLAGKWRERTNGHPDPRYWNEPEHHGGKYSIINKLQRHREEILKIIGGCSE